MDSEVKYRSRVHVERVKGLVRRVYLPAEQEPLTFGVHDELAVHYHVDTAVVEPHASSLDYLVAATAG